MSERMARISRVLAVGGTTCHWLHLIRSWKIVIAFASILICPGRAQTLDYSELPKSKDNFLSASFRFSVFQGISPSHTILLFVPGTDEDGRFAATDPTFTRVAAACHADIIGCYFRGEGRTYDDPTGGSGSALDRSLAFFAEKIGRSDLTQSKVLALGYSQGGMFVYNYVCWRPSHVKAFACLRAIFPRLEPQSSSFQVPGLLAAGEHDEPGRTRGIAKAFEKAADHNSKWSFLWERDAGHEMGKSPWLAGLLFESVCRDVNPASPVRMDTMGRTIGELSSIKTDACWFPDDKVADAWKSLHRLAPLHEVASIPDALRLSDMVSIQRKPELLKCPNGASDLGSLLITARESNVPLGEVKLTGEGFSLSGRTTEKPPSEIKVRFEPKNMPWGEACGHLTVAAATGDLVPLDVTIYGLVEGSVASVPSTAYLGVSKPGQELEKTILLKTTTAHVHIAAMKSPPGVTVSLGVTDKNGDIPLRIKWVGGTRLGRMEGIIELTVDGPEAGTLRIPIFGYVLAAAKESSSPALDSRSNWRTTQFSRPGEITEKGNTYDA